MDDRTRARGPSPLRYVYTPELLAHGRHLYEETDTSIPDIAVDFGIHKTTLQRLANRKGWVRYRGAPRDLLPAVRTALEAEASLTLPPRSGGEGRFVARQGDEAGWGVSHETKTPPAPNPSPPLAALVGGGEQASLAAGGDEFPPLSEIHARLLRAALEELAAVEALRARLRREPHSPLDGERTSRTLSSIQDTISRIQRSQCGLPTGPYANDDDMPADLDAFREQLARRIRAFVESRRGSEAGDGEDSA